MSVVDDGAVYRLQRPTSMDIMQGRGIFEAGAGDGAVETRPARASTTAGLSRAAANCYPCRMPQLKPTTLTTERLTLRWLTADDAAAQFALFSDPEVMRYWSSAPWTDLAQARAAIEQVLAEYRDGTSLRFAITLRDGGAMIGNIRLYDFFDQNRRCDIGYALVQAHWGQGYLAEAMAAVLDYGFAELNLNRVEADIDPRNAASQKLLERMSFEPEGYMRERWIVNGEVCDTEFYGLLKSDWEAR